MNFSRHHKLKFVFGILAALLFGVATPLAKRLLSGIGPLTLSAVLYAGAGLGAWAMILLAPRRLRAGSSLERGDWPFALGMILLGGVIGPCFLFYGMERSSALATSLLLPLETVFTVIIALTLGERLSRKEFFGIALFLAASLLVTFEAREGDKTSLLGVVAVTAAMLAWGGDNNVTKRLSDRDPLRLVRLKGLVAAPVSFGLALAAGERMPGPEVLFGGAMLGVVSYGGSIALFVLSLRAVGAARTGAIFSTSAFFGAALSVMLGDPLSVRLVSAALLAAAGIGVMASAQGKAVPMASDDAHGTPRGSERKP